jgi:murein DD-endopeptidase MepM/ murein hydrolase activator NlpD
VRKTSVIPAAVLAAGFVFGSAQAAEAKHTHKKVVSASANTVPEAPAKAVHASRAAGTSKISVSKALVSKKSSSSKSATRRNRPGTAKTAEPVEAAELYGPFLPAETYDYPQPPCSELDAIIEAHEHEADEDTPEADEDVAEAVPPANPLTRVARTLGSWLRPKSSESTLRPEDVDLSDLISSGVQIPVEGVDVSRLKDSFLNSRGQHRQHLAIDIGAPKGTPVLAAADGEIVRLGREKRGGISLYQKDASGKYLLFYCHLTKYIQGLKAGRKVQKGDVIAYVGRTGHVIGGPHLHFSITRLPEDDDNFKAGIAINPYLLFVAAVP